MDREITKYGNPVLRRKGARVETITPAIRTLVTEMFAALDHAQGVGLAAQQVGEALQLCVIDVRPSDRPSWMEVDGKRVDPCAACPMALINPVLEPEEPSEVGPEGCLSFPDIFADIKRPSILTVSALDQNGAPIHFRCGGLLARAIQHECDHLEGVLFIDRMGYIDREDNDEALRRLRLRTKDRLKRRAIRG